MEKICLIERQGTGWRANDSKELWFLMGTIILFNGSIFRWFNVALGLFMYLGLMLVLFAFQPGAFDGFNAVIDAGGGSSWLLTCSFLINLPCQVALLRAAKLLLALGCRVCAGFICLHQPEEHPRASLEKTQWNGCFLVLGRRPARCELCSVPSGELSINQWMGSGTKFRWGQVVHPQRKEVRQQTTE